MGNRNLIRKGKEAGRQNALSGDSEVTYWARCAKAGQAGQQITGKGMWPDPIGHGGQGHVIPNEGDD